MNIQQKNNRISFLKQQLAALENIDKEFYPKKDKRIDEVLQELNELKQVVSVTAIKNDFGNRIDNDGMFSLGSEYPKDVKEMFIFKQKNLIDKGIQRKWKKVQKAFGLKNDIEITDETRMAFLKTRKG